MTASATTSLSALVEGSSFTIAPAPPIITWTTPTAISYGTALGSAQLDAMANVAGSFVYTSAAGTIPE